MERLQSAFLKCEKLQRHVRFLYTNGSLYKVYNGNLLYHGCVPLNNDGTFRKVRIFGKEYSGKALYDILESYIRKAFMGVSDREGAEYPLVYLEKQELTGLWKRPDDHLREVFRGGT